MESAIWLSRESNPPTTALRGFAERLTAAQWTTTQLTIPTTGGDTGWILSQIPAGTRLVLMHDLDSAWVSRVVAALDAAAERNFVTVLVHEGLKPAQILDFAKSGVQELVSHSEPTADFISRVVFRTAQTTGLKELKKQVRTSALELAKSETGIKQREEFLSVCAHDLRSPLGLVQASLSMLLGNKTAFNDFQVELISRARRQAEQGIRLVNDLLDVMAYEQGLKPDFQLVSLDSFLSELHQDYSFQAEAKKIKLHYENPAKELRVLIDPDRIRQLFQNLLVNALKFTEAGKNIHLNVMPFQGRRKQDPPYPMIVVSLRDEGRGIPKDEVERIFNKFAQVKDYGREQGRGLGLSVAKQISTLHNGNLWVQSVEGEGSTFFVLFPYVLGHRAVKPKTKTAKQIVVAEPDVAKRAQYFEILGRWGYEPVFANDGAEALTLACFHQPTAVLLGAGLPKVSENDVVLALKSDSVMKNTPVISFGQPTVTGKTKPLFDANVQLPFTRETFEIALDRAKQNVATPIKRAA